MSRKKSITIPLQTYYETLLIMQDIIDGEYVAYNDLMRVAYNLRSVTAIKAYTAASAAC